MDSPASFQIMKTITSKDNPLIKEAASLKEKKYRDGLGMFLVEGPNLVRELMEFGGRPRFIFLKAGAGDEAQQLALKAEKLTAVYEIPEGLFSKVATDNTPQGIIAAANKPEWTMDRFFEETKDRNILVLDRLQDPGNTGTLIRTAEALGFGGIIFVKGTADPFQPKVVRAAAGSVLRMPMLFLESGKDAAVILKAKGKKLYAAFMEGSVSIQDADLKANAAVVIGNEGNGVSQELAEASEKLFIPMDGKTESLNAAIAGTIIMYESKRQRS